jgi:hypothetical protein
MKLTAKPFSKFESNNMRDTSCTKLIRVSRVMDDVSSTVLL